MRFLTPVPYNQVMKAVRLWIFWVSYSLSAQIEACGITGIHAARSTTNTDM